MKPSVFHDDDSEQYSYIVDQSSFDKIHERIFFFSKHYKPYTAYVESEFGTGSGVVINLQRKEVQIDSETITARHVVEDTKTKELHFPRIYQGLSEFGDGRANYVAEHSVEEICFQLNSKKDIALLRGKVIKNNSGTDLISIKNITAKVAPQQVSENEDNLNKTYFMNHYPLGTTIQRFNFGKFLSFKNGFHEISSLPGSSGAGIFGTEGLLQFIHTRGGEISKKEKVLYDLPLLEELPKEKRIYEIASYNESETISQEDLNRFTECYRKKPEKMGGVYNV